MGRTVHDFAVAVVPATVLVPVVLARVQDARVLGAGIAVVAIPVHQAAAGNHPEDARVGGAAEVDGAGVAVGAIRGAGAGDGCQGHRGRMRVRLVRPRAIRHGQVQRQVIRRHDRPSVPTHPVGQGPEGRRFLLVAGAAEGQPVGVRVPLHDVPFVIGHGDQGLGVAEPIGLRVPGHVAAERVVASPADQVPMDVLQGADRRVQIDVGAVAGVGRPGEVELRVALGPLGFPQERKPLHPDRAPDGVGFVPQQDVERHHGHLVAVVVDPEHVLDLLFLADVLAVSVFLDQGRVAVQVRRFARHVRGRQQAPQQLRSVQAGVPELPGDGHEIRVHVPVGGG